MNNTYIQDKLDELIETYRKEMTVYDTNGECAGELVYFTEYDARMIAERLAADYHNHIVEKIEEYANSQTDEAVAMGIIGTVSLLKD